MAQLWLAIPVDSDWLDGSYRPEHPIVIPPDTETPPDGGGETPPTDPDAHPEHPIELPPGIDAHPEHPIVLPPSDAHPEHPIYIPPTGGEGPRPEHPIYIPVYPAHPIAPGGDEGQPTPPIYVPVWPPGFLTGNLPPFDPPDYVAPVGGRRGRRGR